jgi:hypothetical protein
MADVSLLVRCRYCGAEVKVANGQLLKPPNTKLDVWWVGENPPNPTKIRLTGICDAHEIGNQDSSTSLSPPIQGNDQGSTDAEKESEMQE